ncbi:MAG: OmpA family protein, partial [Bacteroidia bacterium]
GHVGFGGYDIFVTTIGNNFTLSNPQNLGKPFNSSKDDMAYISDKDGVTGYLSSNRDNDNGIDKVYYFNNNYTPVPKKTVLPKTDTTMVAIAKVETTLKKDAAKSVTIKIEEDKNVTNTIGGKMILLTNAYFTFNSSNLPTDLSTFKEIFTQWQKDKNAMIEIVASTDCRGSEEYNLALSKKRAVNAQKYFTQRGVPANKIAAIGVGENTTESNCDDCDKCTEEMHQANRKVQLILRK